MDNAAYEIEKLIPFTVQIGCIAAYDDYLVVGDCLGQLLWYITSPTLQLLRADLTFSTKPVMQLGTVSGLPIVVSLSAERGMSWLRFSVSSDLSVQYTATDLPDSRGVGCFALDEEALAVWTSGKKKTGKTVVRLCGAGKRRLHLYVWNDKEFFQLPSIDTKLDAPRTLVWCGQSIVVGCKNEYFLVDINTKLARPLILTGTCLEPIVVKMSDTTFGVVKDSQLLVMSTTAVNAAGEQIIKLDDTPYSVAYDAPYLLTGFSNTIRVQTAEPFDGNHVVRQRITTNSKILNMCCCENGLIYAVSTMSVWRLKPVQLGAQIEGLLKEKHFQLALKLASKIDESVDDRQEKETRIRKSFAIDLFDKKNYRECVKEFSKLNVDPRFVVELFLNSLSRSDSDRKKGTVDEETEMKIGALIEYLTEARRKGYRQPSNNGDDETMKGDEEKLLETIDDGLLKCYLQTNDAFVAPIIRLNRCGLVETETTLKNHEKYNELIILYQVKGMHREALEFLKKHSHDSASILNGPEKTIQYLQHMGPEDVDVVLEFSDWVLDEFPERGLGIFTADVGEVEQWPRRRVYGRLAAKHPALVTAYLEHVIHEWHDPDATFHDALIDRYARSLRGRDRRGPASTETETDPDDAADTRAKLLTFLERSDHYSLETALDRFPICDECFEERIRVLEKLGRHVQVLSLYVYKLNDVDRAVRHCDKVYASNDKHSDQIYVNLLRLLNHPPDAWLAEIGRVPRLTPNLEKTVEILNEYATVTSFSDALPVISDDIPVRHISQGLVTALETAIGDKRRYQLHRGLLFALHFQMREQKAFYESQNVVLTRQSECCVCRKHFGGNSAFVKCLDGNIAHLSCYNKRQTSLGIWRC